MSDASASAPITAEKPLFSEKEVKCLVAAMLSLKGGLPSLTLDYDRFQTNGKFNTVKTAQNTWGTLKKKITTLNPEAAAKAADGTAPSTPKKAKAAPKKRTMKDGDEESPEEGAEADEGSAKKKQKTPAKKTPAKKAVAAEGEAGEEATPTKKKATPRKKASPKKSPTTVKEEETEEAATEEAAAEETEKAAEGEKTEGEKEKEKTPAAEDVKMENTGGD